MASALLARPSRPLHGRSALVGAVAERLAARGGLITLVGPVGVGKTHAASVVVDRWRPRLAYETELVHVHDADGLASRVAVALDPGASPQADPGPRLPELGAALLVLDGADALSSGARDRIATWLRSAPSLRVLATSQQPLGLPEESVVGVRPLPVESPPEVLESPAWAVVRDAAPSGTLDEVSPIEARDLLAALEGLPLSLVLAAGRLEVLPWKVLLERRNAPLQLLADPDRTGPHASLAAALQACWALLDADLQDVLGQAAAFEDTFDLTAAEAVLRPRDGSSPIDALQRLIRRNLVDRRGDGYRLPSAVRAFARSRAAPARWRAAVHRHAEGFAEWSRRRFDDRGSSRAWLDETGAVIPELDAVVARAASDSTLQEAAITVSSARAAWSGMREVPAATARAIDETLALVPPSPTPDASGWLAYVAIRGAEARGRLGQEAVALQLAEQALAHAERSGRPLLVSMAHQALGVRRQSEGDLAAAEASYRAALAAYDEGGIGASYRADLAIVLALREGPDAAAPWIDAALAALPSDPPDPDAELQVRKAEGWLFLDQPGLTDRAVAAFERAHALGRELDKPREVAFALGQRGLARAVVQDRPAEALADFAVIIEEMARQGDSFQEGSARLHRAGARLRVGDLPGAAEDLRLARQRLQPISGAREELAEALELALQILNYRAQLTEGPGPSDVGATARPTISDAAREAAPALATLAEALDAARQAARAMLENLVPTDELEIQRLVQTVEEQVRRHVESWIADPDGAWLEDPAGTRYDFTGAARHPALVKALVDARIASPGEGLGVDELVAAGWPGERVLPRAASTRIRVALTALRKAGLRDLLLRGADGWFLDPGAPLRRATG